jgi:predicted  nucleic acid-binding Zn-ribbon protein
MAWFLNNYTCYRCGKDWSDAWSCMCDDDCPYCGARHSTPVDSDDLTVLVEPDGNEFVVLRSPDTAEHDPDYREVGRFPSSEKAEEFLASIESDPGKLRALSPELAKHIASLTQGVTFDPDETIEGDVEL